MEAAALWIAFFSFAAAAGSAIFAGFQYAASRKAADRAEQAETSAQKSADSALSAYVRTSEALEAMALIAGPPWTVRYFGGDAYLLTNNSTVPATDVEIDGEPEGVDISIDEDLPWVIGPKSAKKFMFVAMLNTPFTRDLVVRWRRNGEGETLEWRHPIPLKPR